MMIFKRALELPELSLHRDGVLIRVAAPTPQAFAFAFDFGGHFAKFPLDPAP